MVRSLAAFFDFESAGLYVSTNDQKHIVNLSMLQDNWHAHFPSCNSTLLSKLTVCWLLQHT
jgi:hypothetical protein